VDIKVMNLRIPEEMAAEIAAVARTEEVSISEVIRAAINRYLAACRVDQAFRERLKERLEEDREVLERLTSWGEGGGSKEN
jgi:Arc/MetJ-type ribon-helix-helix transcriptional regulator